MRIEQNSKYPLRQPSQALEYSKTILQGDSTLGSETAAYSKGNQPFRVLSQISEEDLKNIIQEGFQLQAEGKISLKKYYESTDPNSLFQLQGYRIKYEAIRKNKFYQQFKPSNN